MKRMIGDLTEKERIATLDALYTAASAVQGRAAVKAFLRDLLTESERIMLGRRIIIARMLLEGHTYDSICSSLQTSQKTVAKIQRWLEDQFPGYEDAIKGMEETYANRAEKKRFAESPLYRLKKRYPLHFLLFPVGKRK